MTRDVEAPSDGSANLKRAVCNAAGAAEAFETDVGGSGMMEAIFLKNYVKSIEDTTPASVPKPTFATFLSSSKKTVSEPLIHVKITHTAINHVDLLYAQGRHQNNHSGLFTPPFTLGLEFSGIVLAVYNPTSHNNKSSSFQPGDLVWGGGLGTHACELIVPESAVHRVPSGWTLHDIAGVGAATAPVSYGALINIANLQRGETILVHAAAGGLGVIAVQIARALGAKVIATVGSKAKARVIIDLLADPQTGQIPKGEGVINYNFDKEWHRTVLSITSPGASSSGIYGASLGPGVDVVYDTVGLVAQSIRCTRFNGRVVIAGFAGRTGLGSSPDAALENIPTNRLLLKQIKLLGYRYGETSRRLPTETVKMWDGMNTMLEKKQIAPVIYKMYKGLEHVKDGMRALGRREVYGKAVVEVCDVEEAKRYVSERIENSGTMAKL